MSERVQSPCPPPPLPQPLSRPLSPVPHAGFRVTQPIEGPPPPPPFPSDGHRVETETLRESEFQDSVRGAERTQRGPAPGRCFKVTAFNEAHKLCN